MEKLSVVFAIIIIASCNNKKQSPTEVNRDSLHQSERDSIHLTAEDSARVEETYNVVHADLYVDTIFFYINRAINKMTSTNNEDEKSAAEREMDRLAKPYQMKLDSIEKLLPPDKVQEINNYRQKRLDEIRNGTFQL